MEQIGLVGVAVLATRLLDMQIALAGGGLQLTPGLATGLALLFGPFTAWGVAVGHLVADIVSGAFVLASTVEAAAQFILVATVCLLWGSFGRLSSGQPPGSFTGKNAVEYVLLSVTATALTVAVTAWGQVLIGVRPFAVTVVDKLPELLISVLTVGALLLYGGRKFLTMSEEDWASPPASQGTPGLAVLAIALIWGAASSGISLIFQSTELVVTHALINQLGRGVGWLLLLAGPDGVYLQSGVGLLAVGLCARSFLHRSKTDD